MIEITPMAPQALETPMTSAIEDIYSTPISLSEDMSVRSSSNKGEPLSKPVGKIKKNDESSHDVDAPQVANPSPDPFNPATRPAAPQPDVDLDAEAFSLFAPDGRELSTVGFVKLAVKTQPVATTKASCVPNCREPKKLTVGGGIVKEVLDNPFGTLDSDKSK
jgi:hypothetical protein